MCVPAHTHAHTDAHIACKHDDEEEEGEEGATAV